MTLKYGKQGHVVESWGIREEIGQTIRDIKREETTEEPAVQEGAHKPWGSRSIKTDQVYYCPTILPISVDGPLKWVEVDLMLHYLHNIFFIVMPHSLYCIFILYVYRPYL